MPLPIHNYLPKGNDYGIRLNQKGNRISVGDISTKLKEGIYTLEYKIAPERMTSVGYGEVKPIASNETASNRQLNRRTAIKVIQQ